MQKSSPATVCHWSKWIRNVTLLRWTLYFIATCLESNANPSRQRTRRRLTLDAQNIFSHVGQCFQMIYIFHVHFAPAV